MDTTLLVVELLIAGTQVSVWLFMLILTLFGYSWIQTQTVTDWQSTAVILFLAFSYSLGVAFDRFADFVFEPWNRHLKKKMIPSPPFPIGVMRFEVGKDNEGLNHQFEYTRSRMRVARASAINIGLIAISVIAFVLVRVQGVAASDKVGLCAAILGVGICFASLCVYAWQNLTKTYLELVKTNYDRLRSDKASKKAG